VPGEDLGRITDAGSVQQFVQGDGGDQGLTIGRVLHQDVAGMPGLAEAGDRFGAALALQGDLPMAGDSGSPPDLVIGVPGEDIGSVADAGALCWLPLRRNGSAIMARRGSLLPGTPVTGDRLGAALSTRVTAEDEYSPMAVTTGGSSTPRRPGTVLTWFAPPFLVGQPSTLTLSTRAAAVGGQVPVPAADTSGV